MNEKTVKKLRVVARSLTNQSSSYARNTKTGVIRCSGYRMVYLDLKKATRIAKAKGYKQVLKPDVSFHIQGS